MLIGELAKKTGVSIDTVRYYEKEGLVSPVNIRESGYRDFDDNAVSALEFTLRAKKLGFSLRQIKDLLILKESPDTTCIDIRALAEKKLNEVKLKIKSLKQMEKQLQQLVTECLNTSNENCPIIENLEEGNET